MKLLSHREQNECHAFACDHCGHRSRPASSETIAFIQARTEGFTVLVTPQTKISTVAQVKIICATCRPLFGPEVEEANLPELPACR